MLKAGDACADMGTVPIQKAFRLQVRLSQTKTFKRETETFVNTLHVQCQLGKATTSSIHTLLL